MLAENATLTHTSSLLGSLGLFLLIFGLVFGVRRALGEGTMKRVLVTLGVLLVAFAGIGLAFGHGLNHMIAHTINHGGSGDPRTLFTIAVTIQAVKAGIVIISGYGYLLGFACMAAGLSLHFSPGLHRRLAVLVFLISAASLVSLLIGDHFHDLAGTFYTLADYGTMPLNLWALILGVAMTREHTSLTPGRVG